MAKKKRIPCHPLDFAIEMAGDGTADWLSNLKTCEEFIRKRAWWLKKFGYIENDSETTHISHSIYTVGNWLKFKQCYRPSEELAADLFSMDDLSFPLHQLHLPFPTIYLDVEGLRFPKIAGRNSVGAYIMIEENVPFGETFASCCSIVTIGYGDGEYSFGGISFDFYPEHMEKTLENTIRDLTKGFDDERVLITNALLFAAYLSSSRPDVTENESHKKIYRATSKNKPSSLRKWDVGIRYMEEKKRVQTAKETQKSQSNRRSPRPHFRKAHWQTYRVGAGRKETVVRWIAPVSVGIIDAKQPVVIRKKETD